MLIHLVAAALLAAAPAAAVTVTSLPGAPDPGIAFGETRVASFDTPLAAGVVNTTAGSVITAAGSIGGVRAAPAWTGSGVYQSIGAGGSSLFDFSAWGSPLSSFSLYWGSIDSYNFIDFLDANGLRIAGLSGSDLPRFDGNQTASASNRRVVFGFAPFESITAVRLRSTGAAFEYDDIGAAAHYEAFTGAVPEPASWALLITGFGLIGVSMRRRRTVVAV